MSQNGLINVSLSRVIVVRLCGHIFGPFRYILIHFRINRYHYVTIRRILYTFLLITTTMRRNVTKRPEPIDRSSETISPTLSLTPSPPSLLPTPECTSQQFTRTWVSCSVSSAGSGYFTGARRMVLLFWACATLGSTRIMMSTRTSTTTLRVTRSTVFLLTRVIRGFIWISKGKEVDRHCVLTKNGTSACLWLCWVREVVILGFNIYALTWRLLVLPGVLSLSVSKGNFPLYFM